MDRPTQAPGSRAEAGSLADFDLKGGAVKHHQAGAACTETGSHRGGAGPSWSLEDGSQERQLRKKLGPGSHGGAGPAVRQQGCQCHFLPIALEKTNQLNRLHMVLQGAEGESTAALPVKENIFKHCCH